jgi:hypothetical protein
MVVMMVLQDGSRGIAKEALWFATMPFFLIGWIGLDAMGMMEM